MEKCRTKNKEIKYAVRRERFCVWCTLLTFTNETKKNKKKIMKIPMQSLLD